MEPDRLMIVSLGALGAGVRDVLYEARLTTGPRRDRKW